MILPCVAENAVANNRLLLLESFSRPLRALIAAKNGAWSVPRLVTRRNKWVSEERQTLWREDENLPHPLSVIRAEVPEVAGE